MKSLMALICCFFITVPVSAEILVVINKENSLTNISKTELIELYMGRQTHFSNGQIARTIDYNNSKLRSIFYKNIIGKSIAQIDSYWARIHFSGQKKICFQVQDSEQLLSYVRRYKSAIGYIDSKDINENVKVIYTLGSM